MGNEHTSRRHFLKAVGTTTLAAGLPVDRGLLASLHAAITGFLFGEAAVVDDGMWPFNIEFDGAIVTVYQPQPETLDGNVVTGRAAISYQAEGSDTPIFGSFKFRATLEIDTEERIFVVKETTVLELTMPKGSPEELEEAKAMLSEGLSGFDGVFDLDPLMEDVGLAQTTLKESQDLNTEPPKIVTVEQQTMLVTIDGDPKLAPAVEGSKVQRVINTPFTILQDPESKKFYLKGEEWWYVANAPTGPWVETEGVPEEIIKVIPKTPEELEEEAREAKEMSLEGDAPPPAKVDRPAVVVATEPTELIWTSGPVEWKKVPNTSLKYAANSSGYVFQDGSGKTYTVLSGRWYSGPSIEGPWTFVPSDKLPADFQKIPTDSDSAGALPFVAGTAEADAAVKAQQVPTTAEVKKGATTRVNWAGNPAFNDITGTAMRASENAGSPVIKTGSQYFTCQSGIWYVSNEPNGTYTVATSVPNEIYTIPPQHPFYFTTFVKVFGQNEDTVFTGYYPGYKGSYTLGNTVVNGTGYQYPTTVINNTYIGSPAPPTWGFGMTFNPWMGWSMGMGMGFGMGAGWFVFSVGRPSPWGPWWGPVGFNPWWRPPFHAGFRPPMGWYRPVYRPPYVPVYRPGGNLNRPGYGGNYNRPGRPGGGGGYYGGYQPSNRPRPAPRPGGVNNIYNRPANQDRVRPVAKPGYRPPTGGGGTVSLPNVNGKPGKPATRPGTTGPSTRPTTKPGGSYGSPSTRPATRPPNNVYTDKSGNVYRRDNAGNWQQNNNGKWEKPSTRPQTGGGQAGGAKPAPGGGYGPSTRPAPTPDLGAAANARDKAGYRNPGGASMSGGSRPAPKPAPGGSYGGYKPPSSGRPPSSGGYKPPSTSRAPSSGYRPPSGGGRPSGGSRPSGGGGRRR